MPFCSNCGAKLNDGDNFCSLCGTKSGMQPSSVGGQSAETFVVPQPVPMASNDFCARFSRITVRYRCPQGHTFDGNESITQCPTCGAVLNKGGYIQMYRCGNYMGMAVGMGIYIDDVPFGHIGNKQSLRISVPFGTHKVHVTHTTTRACNDPLLTVTPESPYVWCKARFVRAGFKINVDMANPQDMPVV